VRGDWGAQIAADLRATYLLRTKLLHKASSPQYENLKRRMMKINLTQMLQHANRMAEDIRTFKRCVVAGRRTGRGGTQRTTLRQPGCV
jgi:hypothetical protein